MVPKWLWTEEDHVSKWSRERTKTDHLLTAEDYDDHDRLLNEWSLPLAHSLPSIIELWQLISHKIPHAPAALENRDPGIGQYLLFFSCSCWIEIIVEMIK